MLSVAMSMANRVSRVDQVSWINGNPRSILAIYIPKKTSNVISEYDLVLLRIVISRSVSLHPDQVDHVVPDPGGYSFVVAFTFKIRLQEFKDLLVPNVTLVVLY